MKKYFLALAFAAFTAATAAGGDVAVLAENDKGDRLLAKAETFGVKANKHGILVASVTSFWASDPSAVLYWAVDVNSCSEGQGELVGGTDTSTRRFFWHKDGMRVYDGVARELCAAAAAVLQRNPAGKKSQGINL